MRFSIPPLRASVASLLAPAALLVSFSGAAMAEPINDPFPEKIAKGDVRVELKTVASGLTSPLLLLTAPGDAKRIFVVDQIGLVRVIADGVLQAEPFLDVRDRVVKLNPDYEERGLLGFAFDPDYDTTGKSGSRRIFTFISERNGQPADFPLKTPDKPGYQSVIASWRVDANDHVDLASRKEILRIDKSQTNHNGGMLAFGPDRLLYISVGDGGGANDLGPGHNPETGNGQDKSVILGKMVRIDVNGSDSANGAYGIPQDNPFAAGGGVREIYALGFRNPWRFSFDGNALIAGEVGQSKVEMVHRVERGGNYGWRLKEGMFKFSKSGVIEKADDSLPAGLINPVLQYDHDEGTSITGGYVYHAKALPALEGQYVFADFRSPSRPDTGRLFFGDLAKGTIREARIGANDREVGFLVKGFGIDQAGEIYLCGSAKQGPSGTGGVVAKLVAP